MKVVVVGAGIGGLATAVGLRRAGIEVEVYERAPELREVGAGISLWTNAILALRALGLEAPVLAAGAAVRRIENRRMDGSPLLSVDVEAIGRRVGAPMVCIHRATLLEILAAALPPGVVRLGKVCVDVSQDASGATARFEDGAEARGDAVLGADGLRSAVRARTLGEARPRYSGYLCWRAIAPLTDPRVPEGVIFECLGPGARFGVAPVDAGRTYLYVTKNAPEGAPADPRGHKAELLERFGAPGWDPLLGDLLRATPEEAFLRNEIADRPPARRWGEGRITLLGDAAHPTTPNLGQGGCQAIEDAVVLSGLLAEGGAAGVPKALRAYEAARRGRTAGITRRSRLFGWLFQWEDPAACAWRDRVYGLLAPRLTPGEIERLVRFAP